MNMPGRMIMIVWALFIVVLAGGGFAFSQRPASSAQDITDNSLAPALMFTMGDDTHPTGSVRLVRLSRAQQQMLRSRMETTADWQTVFAVYVDDTETDVPPVLGTYTLVGDVAVFTPRYPLQAGVMYRAVAHLDQLETNAAPLTLTFAPDDIPANSPAYVEAVYPSSEVVPENLLRLYIHFSSPMARGEAFEHIHLFAPDGTEIEGAFLRIGVEFWDPSMQRLTLMFDPGRIKRGLAPNVQAGVPLADHGRYRLVIDPNWRTASGDSLAEGYDYSFVVGEADRTAPDMTAWQIAPPTAGTRGPLRVTFAEPLDRALLNTMVWVEGRDGERIAGEISVSRGETMWEFIPTQPWESGDYRLVADPLLEDPSGNSLTDLFDIDLTQSTMSEPITVRTFEVAFG